MKIDYSNMPLGANKLTFRLRYLMNLLRSWVLFHFIYRNVNSLGFTRVMKGTSFAPGTHIQLGHNVQFGDYCNVATDLQVGNYVLFSGRVCFVGRQDHQYDKAGKTIWQSEHICGIPTIVGNDVWLGHRVTVVGPVKIGDGSIVAAGAVVTTDIPPCEIWGGVPAHKLKDRFATVQEKQQHLDYLKSLSQSLAK